MPEHDPEPIRFCPECDTPMGQLCEDQAPWDWLAACVTQDGEGYLFVQSPAGGRARITDEQRRRIVACVNACRGFSTKQLEELVEMDDGVEDGGELLNVWANYMAMGKIQ